jgi:NADH:ubiquinone oxidoreductase subunit 6 (subunit J)
LYTYIGNRKSKKKFQNRDLIDKNRLSLNKNLHPKNMMEYILYFFVAILLTSLVAVAFLRNLIHAVFSLLVVFLCLVVLYVFLGADFVAVAQLMIYVGGILILLVFGVMLANRKEDTQQMIVENRSNIFAGLITLLVAIGFSWEMLQADFLAKPLFLPQQSPIKEIGILLLTKYLFAFELAGVLLLVALIGATLIASKSTEK